jgi:hypothetical protein
MKPLLVLCLLLIAIPAMAQQQLTFAWDLSPDDSLLGAGGYHLYQSKTSGTYAGAPVATAMPGISTVTITATALGRHYWVATAFFEDGTESDYSNEVTAVIKPKPPKLNAVQQIAHSMASAVDKIAGLFKEKKNLKIKE